MRRLVAALVTAMILSVSLAMGSAQARTPTPTPTLTVTPRPYPTPWPTSTPRPPAEQTDSFEGTAWLDAQMSAGPIVARIGEQTCSEETPVINIPCDPACTVFHYYIDVVSQNLKPGCGTEGAPITFFVAGKQASQTAAWHAGASQFLNLVAGPPFASIGGNFAGTRGLPILHYPYTEESSVLIPYIDGVACGYDDYFWCDVQGGCSYSAIVYSDEQRSGCGYEGAPITFRLLDSQRNLMATAEERGVWHSWDGSWSDQPGLDLTFFTPGGIRIGSVGTGDSQSGGHTSTGVVVTWLAIGGLATVAAGAMLRKKAKS